jgi:hypothetical protein
VQCGFAHCFAQPLHNYLTIFVKPYNISCLTVKRMLNRQLEEVY